MNAGPLAYAQAFLDKSVLASHPHKHIEKLQQVYRSVNSHHGVILRFRLTGLVLDKSAFWGIVEYKPARSKTIFQTCFVGFEKLFMLVEKSIWNVISCSPVYSLQCSAYFRRSSAKWSSVCKRRYAGTSKTIATKVVGVKQRNGTPHNPLRLANPRWPASKHLRAETNSIKYTDSEKSCYSYFLLF